jgi:hypothetical protein
MIAASTERVAVARPVAAGAPAHASWGQRAVLIGGVVGIVVIWMRLPHADWYALLARIGPALPLLLAVAVGWMALYARGLHEIVDGAVDWGRLLYIRVVGEAYNVIMPIGDVGGDPLRIATLGAQVGTAGAVRAIVLDRLVYVTSGFLFSAATSTAAVRAFTWDARLERLLVGYATVALAAAAVLFLLATRPAAARALGRLLRVVHVRVPVMPSALPARVFVRALGWNLLGRAGALVEIALILLALGEDVRPQAVVAITGILSVTGIVFFFVPNGLGVNEGATVFAFTLTGYGEGVGLAVGLVRRARQLLLALAGVALHALWPLAPRARPQP